MGSFLKSISDFFGKIFSFGRKLLSDPFFDHVFSIAGLLYPPAAPIIDAVDRLFEQKTEEGFLENLDEILGQSGLDQRQVEVVKHLVSMLLLTVDTQSTDLQNEKKAALTREILKTAIASNTGEFRSYGVSDAIRRLYDLNLKEVSNKDQIPDHLLNFSIELAVVQRKLNRAIDQIIAYSQKVMEPLEEATEEEIRNTLSQGQSRGLWSYTPEDYQRPEIRKAVAALLIKEKAVQEKFELWGRVVESIKHVPDSLANLAVEACYANLKTQEKIA